MEIIHHHFETLTSTNDWAKTYLSKLKEHEILCVSADEQTHARGQYGRSWLSPKGENLYASFAFRGHFENPLEFIYLLAMSTAHVLKTYGILCLLKLPNDLLVNSKKIAGILCECSNLGIVLGIGLNVNMQEPLLQKINQPATSIFEETREHRDIKKLLAELEKSFMKHFETIK